jgi:hypothetical protein
MATNRANSVDGLAVGLMAGVSLSAGPYEPSRRHKTHKSSTAH